MLKHPTAVWLAAIAAICGALILFGVSWQVAVGVWIICAALRVAGIVAAASRTQQ